MSETAKAHDRRVREGWYDKYVFVPVIDIGSGPDPLPIHPCDHYDYQWVTVMNDKNELVPYAQASDRDAQFMRDVADESYATVYASHILEHLPDPHGALRNWWRILRPGGNLIICVPHRDLYEKKKTHPSRWNPCDRPGGGGHLTFWLPDRDEAPDTLSLRRVLNEALPDATWLVNRILAEGYDFSLPADVHPVGEYAIEVILQKTAGS